MYTLSNALDTFVKQNAYGKVKTDGGASVISPANEIYNYSKVVRPVEFWTDTPVVNGSNTSNITRAVMTDIYSSIPSLAKRTWKLADAPIVPPVYGAVFTPLFEWGSSYNIVNADIYPYTFDYTTGILNFLGALPPFGAADTLVCTASKYTGSYGACDASQLTKGVLSNTLMASNQPNIVSVGKLNNLNVAGNIVTDSNGWVGVAIGSSSNPQRTLHVQGDIFFSGNLYQGAPTTPFVNSQWITTKDGACNLYYLPAGGQGNVGVGLSNPTEKLHVLGTAIITSNTSITSGSISSNTSTGALTVSGGIGVGGNVISGCNITCSGVATILNTTSATTYNTGALVVTGGIGVGGNVYVGNNTSIYGSLVTGLSNQVSRTQFGYTLGSNTYWVKIVQIPPNSFFGRGTLQINGAIHMSSPTIGAGQYNTFTVTIATDWNSGGLTQGYDVSLQRNNFNGTVTPDVFFDNDNVYAMDIVSSLDNTNTLHVYIKQKALAAAGCSVSLDIAYIGLPSNSYPTFPKLILTGVPYTATDSNVIQSDTSLSSNTTFVRTSNMSSYARKNIFTNGGNIGIRTAPNFNFDVSGDMNVSNRILLNSTPVLDSNANLSNIGNIYISGSIFKGGSPFNQSAWGGGNASVGDVYYTGSGNIGIGLSNPTYKLHVSGETFVNGNISSSADIVAFASDERLKTVVGDIQNPLETVCRLKGFKYTFNDIARMYGFENGNVHVGLGASNVRDCLPEAVRPAPFDWDPVKKESRSGHDYLTVQYDKIVPLLVESTKEMYGEICRLKESIRNLEDHIALKEI